MNWYKQAKVKLEFSSYDNLGTFNVLMNGRPYTFYGVDNKEDFKWRIKNRPWDHGKIFNELKRGFSDPELHKKLNPDYTTEEQQQMTSELPSQKELWGW